MWKTAGSTVVLFLLLFYPSAKGNETFEPKECEDGHLNVVNGSDSSEGRLEVCHRHSIRNVCDVNLNFSIINADVACYELGFAGAKEAVNNGTAFGKATHEFAWLANLTCQGYEERLQDCKPGWIFDSDCSKATAIGIRCNKELQIKMRHDGKTSYHGHVELHYAGSWHVLCDQGWSNVNGYSAEVVCHELGLGKALKHYSTGPEPGMTDFLVTNTQCIGQESFLKNCSRHKHLWNITETCPGNNVSHLYCEGPCVNVTVTGATSQSISLTIAWCKSSENQKYYAAEVHYRVSYDITDQNNSSNDFVETDSPYVSIENLEPGTAYNICVQTGVDYHRGPKSCLSYSTNGITDLQTILLSTFLTAALVAVIGILGIMAILIYRNRVHGRIRNGHMEIRGARGRQPRGGGELNPLMPGHPDIN